jgi:choline dehydrogenase-like flavoprotein
MTNVETLVIGSGVAATALTQRLLELNPRASILILEAGPRVKTKDFALWQNFLITGTTPYAPFEDYNYPTRDKPGENICVGATQMVISGGRVFNYGGSTMAWGGWAFRLKPEDFLLQSNTGEGLDWPFDYYELEPYYCQAEVHLAVSGDARDCGVPRSKPYPFRAFPFTLEDRPFLTAMHELGFDYGHLPIARRGVSDVVSRHAPCQTTGTCDYCPFGARYVACDYLDDLREWNDYQNLQVRLGAIVEEIRMDGKHRAAGVTYLDNETGARVTVDAERVIAAAGTIETSKLLLRSRSSEWPNGIGNDFDLVGRNIIAHPYFRFYGTLPANPLRYQPEMDFATAVTRHFDNQKEQATGKFILVNPEASFSFSPATLMQGGTSRAEIDATLLGPNHQLQVHGMIEVFSRPWNRVTDFSAVNHMGMVETTMDYTKDATFEGRMEEITALVASIYKAMGGTLGGKPSVSWRVDHAAATCRMSAEEAAGVTDPNLRVHGVENLFICSNAVFPSIGSVNPTLTLTALALRLGDHLGAASG